MKDLSPLEPPRVGRTQGVIVGVMAVVVLLSGCKGEAPAGSTGATDPTEKAAPVSVAMTPSPPRALVPSTFVVKALSPLPAGAAVTITLTMPSMPMPPNIIRMAPAGSGIYRGQGMFSMAGDWNASVDVSSPQQRLVRDISLTVRS